MLEAWRAGDRRKRERLDGLGGKQVVRAEVHSQGGMPRARAEAARAVQRRAGRPGRYAGHGQAAAKSVEDIVKDAKEKEEMGYDIYQMDSPSREAVQAVRAATNLIIMSSGRMGGA